MSKMTPEERARRIEFDYGVSEEDFARVAAAIREAVAEAYETCANIARKERWDFCAQNMTTREGSMFEQAWAEAAKSIEEDICALQDALTAAPLPPAQDRPEG